jgi:hypothetical protein
MPKEERGNKRNQQQQDIVQWAVEVNNECQDNLQQGQLQDEIQDARVPPVSDDQGPTYLPDGRNGWISINDTYFE